MFNLHFYTHLYILVFALFSFCFHLIQFFAIIIVKLVVLSPTIIEFFGQTKFLLSCFCHKNVFTRLRTSCIGIPVYAYWYEISIAHHHHNIIISCAHSNLRLYVNMCVSVCVLLYLYVTQKSPQKNGNKVATAIAKTVMSLSFSYNKIRIYRHSRLSAMWSILMFMC